MVLEETEARNDCADEVSSNLTDPLNSAAGSKCIRARVYVCLRRGTFKRAFNIKKIYRRMLGCLINRELDRIWKEKNVTQSSCNVRICWRNWEKLWEALVMKADILAEIRIKYFLNARLERGLSITQLWHSELWHRTVWYIVLMFRNKVLHLFKNKSKNDEKNITI
jgi:hypothetical protein